jgi:enoyl-CoA hydratase/carnithine racemase
VSAEHPEHIIATSEDLVRTVVINRPEKKNALTLAMYDRLSDELFSAAEDPLVRVVVITGVDTVFTSGNDLADFQDSENVGEDFAAFRFLDALARFPKPLVAAVNGLAVGIGTTMLLHCDLVYASSGAVFSVPFVRLGVTPEGGSSLLLPRSAGLRRATEMLLLGEPFSADIALEAGLVNEILGPDELAARAAERAALLAAQPPAAVRHAKELIRGEYRDRLLAALHREGKVFRERLASPEAKEAFSAFFEKRPADFSKFE